MLLIVLGIVCIIYDIILNIISPGTFLDILTSFSHIWTALGALLIFTGLYRRRTGSWFWKKWKLWLKLTVGSLLCIAFIISFINLIFIWTPRLTDLQEEGDYVILLGGGIDKNGKLPPSVMKRVEKTAEYLKLHENAVCVVTGGTLKWLPYAEAPEIKRQLVAAGISQERILVEDQALDTIQNFQYSCKMLAEYSGLSQEEILKSRIIVVSNFYHLRRAERLAARMGFENISGIGAQCAPIQIPMSYVREICAYVKLNLRILLTGQPRHLLAKA
ncbi:MAG: YdcF family protein [Treponema sp.]|nr:YdcF family protein [Treponema sp.]